MYLPPFPAILQNLDLTREAFEGSGRVAVPRALLATLLRIAAGSGAFNERGYLLANPDVAAALSQGRIACARQHYREAGYLEGRLGATPSVDERWYLATYPDVAAAVRSGQVGSASEHFHARGAAEGRAPNAAAMAEARAWRAAFGRGE